jgi:hypothetical protein
MTVTRSPAKDTQNAIPVRQARGGFGLIQRLQLPDGPEAALGE